MLSRAFHHLGRTVSPLRCLSRSCSSTNAHVPYDQYKADGSSITQDAPEQADIVIVGGGVAGCSLLYQLAKMGITNTVLIEKDALTAGTTWHTAGLVWRLRPSDVEVEILSLSHRIMTNLEEESGVDPGWINNGGLFIASTKERMDEYKRLHTLGKVYGIDSQVLGPKETKELYPLMNVDDIYASLYSPMDGTIDPAGYCTGLTRVATRKGAKMLQQCSVNGIQTYIDDYGTKRIKAVETDRGTIQTKVVVNCAGVWAPYLGAMAGVNVPLIAMRHAYIVTERIEGIQNMPNVRDHDASVYLKLQGDTLQVGGYEQNPIFWEQVDKDFAFSLFELDWDVFSTNIEGAINRVPVIENTGVRSTVCGPESFTADHKPLLGEAPEVRGFYFSCGYNSSGMMLSGVSQEVAKWIINGRPDFDLYGYDIRRFTSKLTDNHTWIKQRSHESYAKNYAILFPYDEPLASRNMRKDALYEVLGQNGCVYQERQGWERPGWFSDKKAPFAKDYDYYGQYGNEPHEDNTFAQLLSQDYTFNFPSHHDNIRNECLSCRNQAAVFNMSYFGKFYLIGLDAQKAADWIFSNDMQKQPGSTVYTCMLNQRGGTEADLTVSVVEPGSGDPYAPKFEGRGFYLAVGGGSAQHSYSYIKDILQNHAWNCELLDHSEDMGLISVQGPNSRAILQSLTDADLSNEAFPFSTHQIINVAGHSLRAMRLSFVGELGWELHVPNSSAVAVYEAVMDAGKNHGLVNAGYRAIDSLSIEKGYRHWHGDLRSDDTPLESNLAFTCKLKQNVDFQGRSALENQKKNGLTKKLACFTLDEPVPLFGLEAIWRNGELVGFVRRGEYAYSLDKSIGYGYVVNKEGVDNEYLKSGSYELERMGVKYKANIHVRTPFDPKHKRLQGEY